MHTDIGGTFWNIVGRLRHLPTSIHIKILAMILIQVWKVLG